MPASDLLGPDKNGTVYVDEWKRKVFVYMSRKFGEMAACLEKGEIFPWMDPDARTLRRITVKDAAAAEAMFELLMGSDVAPRKEFIATAEIDREHIDA